MIYLFILIFSATNIYAIEKIVPSDNKLAFFFGLTPSLFILILFPSIQFDVGPDYFSYLNMYSVNSDEVERFYSRGEYLFYFIFRSIISFKLGEQAIFVVSTTFNMMLLIATFTVLRKYGYKAWILFIIFFVVTNNYHNQMNGIRQYMALFIFPIIFISLIEKKYIIFIILVLSASFLHKTALVSIILIPLIFLLQLSKNMRLIIFLSLPIVFIFSKFAILYFIENYLIIYSHYIDSSYAEGLGITSILTKLYTLPLFIYFWYLYLQDNEESKLKGMEFGIVIWLATYWLFLLYLDFGFVYRISSYFNFFYIFPLYFVWEKLLAKGKLAQLVIFIVYLITPYLFKVILLAKGVFTYQSIFF